jgi:hypothetical protein
LGAFAATLLLSNTVAAAEQVNVQICASPSEFEQARAVVEELITRLGATPHVERTSMIDYAAMFEDDATSASPAIQAWLDLCRTRDSIVAVAAPSGERWSIKRLPRWPGHEEAEREQNAHALETSILTLVEGEDTLLTRREARRELAPAAAKPSKDVPRSPAKAGILPSQQPSRWYASAVYGGAVFSANSVVHGPRLLLNVPLVRATLQWWLFGGARYQIPVSLQRQPVGVRLWAVGAEGGVAVLRRLGDRWRAGASASGELELTRVEPFVTAGVATASSPYFASAPLARVAVTAQRNLFSDYQLLVEASAAVDPIGTRYTVRQGSADAVVFQPWRVRPGLAFGVSFP